MGGSAAENATYAIEAGFERAAVQPPTQAIALKAESPSAFAQAASSAFTQRMSGSRISRKGFTFRAVIKLTKSLPFPEAKKQEWIKLPRGLRRPALVAACNCTRSQLIIAEPSSVWLRR